MPPDSLATLDAAILARLLRPIGGAGSAVAGFRVIRRRDDYAVIIAALMRSSAPPLDVVVKLAGPHAPLPAPFDRTAAIVQLVRARTAVPTCEPLAADVSCREWPWRYLVTTHIPGATWAEVRPQLEAAALRDAYRQLGRAVAELHTVRFPACGEFDGGGAPVDGGIHVTALARRAACRIADPRHVELFLAVLRDRAALFGATERITLCHDDLNPHNILFAHRGGRWCLAAILDFDSAWAFGPEPDLARLDLWRGMTGDGFRQAYEAIVPIAPGYPERRPLHQLLWCLEYAAPTPRHRADTARVCAALGLAPVTFA